MRLRDLELNLKNIKGDFLGGLTAGIVTLPLALAFGLQSGLGAVAGLYCAIILGLIAVIFGGTPTLISTPTGPMTVVATLAIAQVIASAGSLEAGMGTIIGIFLLAAIFQIIFGVIKVGGYVKYIPYPVLSGFMTGIGVILISLEVYPLVGVSSPKNIVKVFLGLPQIFDQLNFHALTLGALTLVIIFILPRLTKAIPASLVALIVGTSISVFFGLSVPMIGEIPQGLPSLQIGHLPSFDIHKIPFVLSAALTLGALGCIDTLLTAVVSDQITKTRHKSNRELIGQGLGNFTSALFGGLPGAGTTMSTIVSIKAGARTRWAGGISSVFLVAILFGLGKYVQYIPIPVLAAILIGVGFDIIDYKGLKQLAKVNRAEGVILVTVLLMTVFVDLIEAVAVGMILSSVIFMKKMGDIGEGKVELFPLRMLKVMKPCNVREEFILPHDLADRVYIKSINGPVFFGFSYSLQENIKKLPEITTIIFEMNRVPYIDQSAANVYESVIQDLRKQNIEVLLANINGQPLKMFKDTGLIPQIISQDKIFEDIFDCVRSLEERFVLEKSKKMTRLV
jgi:SulP family sulfate permease